MCWPCARRRWRVGAGANTGLGGRRLVVGCVVGARAATRAREAAVGAVRRDWAPVLGFVGRTLLFPSAS